MTPPAEVSPSAATQVVGVIGDPVGHSLSPRLHNAAFDALGLDWVSVAFPVPDGSATDAVAGMRALGIAGLSVTMPHKTAVVALVDRLTPVADVLGAVNCLYRDGDVLVGDNTDGIGFVASLWRGAGFDPDGRRCLVIGAGGAAVGRRPCPGRPRRGRGRGRQPDGRAGSNRGRARRRPRPGRWSGRRPGSRPRRPGDAGRDGRQLVG